MNFSKLFPFFRFQKFFVTTFSGTIIDTLVLWTLATYAFHSYLGQYIIAPTISFEIAVLNNFAFSYFWIWKERVARTRKDYAFRFLLYNVNAVAVFLVKIVLLVTVEMLTGLHVVYCNLIALCFTGLLNFYLQHNLIFAQSRIWR